MASGRRGASETGQTPGGRRGRPPPTIDLTATEVASEPAPAREPEAAPAPPAEAAGEAEPPRPDPGPAESETRASARAESPIERKLGAWLPTGQPCALIAGGIAGAGSALLVLLVLWLLGAFTPRDNGTAVLAGRIATLDAQMRELAARPAPAGDAKAIDDLRTRVDVIDAGLRRLDDRLARAESTLATPRSAPTDPVVLERLGAADSMLRALNATIADLRQRLDEVATAAREARGRADAAAASPGAPNAAEQSELDALAARIAVLERDAKTVNQALQDASGQRQANIAADRAVRLAVVAEALRAAVERGAPFTAELAAAKALGTDGAALAPLEAFAAAGVPTAEALARDFDKVEPAMLAAAAPAAHEGGILDRLQANAERLVRVRPVGDTPGDDPAAGIARARAKAGRGDMAGALAELDRLPAAAKAPAAAWMKAAQARMAAVDSARQLFAASLAALGKPSP
jgi:hypothetical protein